MRNILLLFALLAMGNLSFGQKKVYERLILDWKNNQWSDYGKEKYSYYPDGKLKTVITDYWNNSSNDWGTYYKTSYEYDGQGRILKRLNYEWSKTSNSWNSAHSGAFFDYSASGNIVIETHKMGGAGNWNNFFKFTRNYNSNKQLVTEIQERFSSGAWVKQDLLRHFYDAQGVLNKTEYKFWSSTNNIWTNSGMETYYYTATKLDSSIRTTLKTGSHEKFRRYEYTYDSNGHEASKSMYEWRTFSNTWDIKEKFSYDNEGDGSIKEIIEQKGNGGNLFNHYKFIYDYNSPGTSVIDRSVTTDWLVYPNPVKEVLNLNYPSDNNIVGSIDIINISGVVVKQIKTTQTTIDVSELPVGMYFLKLNRSTESKVVRLIKK